VRDGAAVLAERLAGYGYDVLQGYHFSRPVPEGELVAQLADRVGASAVG
jgi:EAL domain-containing protein (putative c-di-GMP-specific phosphodiesterase class I)